MCGIGAEREHLLWWKVDDDTILPYDHGMIQFTLPFHHNI